MAFRFKDCLEKGLLRKVPASKAKAFSSIKKAEKWLEDARKSLSSEAFDSSVLASYMGFFHSARAILFIDGYREKSHACVARYLEEKYVKTNKLEKKWVDLLDHQREIRHTGQYDLSYSSTGEDAKSAIQSAAKFLERMKELLRSRELN